MLVTITKALTMEFLPPLALKPNKYNPNSLTKTQREKLVNEMRRTGTNKKAIRYRMVNGENEIIDGEQTWLCAQEAGLSEVLCQREEADDFEARKLTFQANIQGDMNPLKLGRMIEQMLTLRPMSNVDLAAQLGCTEGTIRNRRLYAVLADKAKLDPSLPTESQIGKMNLRAVRKALGLEGDGGEKPTDNGTEDYEKSPLAKAKRAFEKIPEEARSAFISWATGQTPAQSAPRKFPNDETTLGS
jgi:hypothetical protein